MNADKNCAFVYLRLSAFVGGPKDLSVGAGVNFGRSSRVADKTSQAFDSLDMF